MKEKLASGKTRITIRLDDDILRWFRAQVRSTAGSYQSLINLSLRDYIAREPLESTLRHVVREELARAAGRSSPHSYDYEAPAALVADSGDASSEYGASLKRKRSARRRRKH